MNSRVPPKYKTNYHVTNCADYDRALVKRGDITLWISEDAIGEWTPNPNGRRGAPLKHSDLAIETDLTLRFVYGLPLRGTEGFLRLLFRVMKFDLSCPITRRSHGEVASSA